MTEPPDDIMPMILSARDQIAFERRCENRGKCDLTLHCQCYRDAEARVRRTEQPQQRAVRPQSLARERYESAWHEKQRLR